MDDSFLPPNPPPVYVCRDHAGEPVDLSLRPPGEELTLDALRAMQDAGLRAHFDSVFRLVFEGHGIPYPGLDAALSLVDTRPRASP